MWRPKGRHPDMTGMFRYCMQTCSSFLIQGIPPVQSTNDSELSYISASEAKVWALPCTPGCATEASRRPRWRTFC